MEKSKYMCRISSTHSSLFIYSLYPLFVFQVLRSACAAVITAAPETFGSSSAAYYNTADIILYDSRYSDITELSMHKNNPNHTGDEVAAAGNVLIRSEGRLLAVCDSGWNRQTANVVCKSLGYETASKHTTRSYFGLPPYGKWNIFTTTIITALLQQKKI